MRSFAKTLRGLLSSRPVPANPAEPKAADPAVLTGTAGPEVELARVRRMIEDRQIASAQAALSQLKSRREPVRGVDYLRALCFLEEKHPHDAIEALKEELRYFPDQAQADGLLKQLQAGQPGPTLPADPEFRELYTIVRPYTMLSVERLFSLYSLAKEVCRLDLPGQIVECGVAAGGSSALLAAVVARYSRRPRRVYACDTFQGLPGPGNLDQHQGRSADALGWGTGTCAAPVDSLLEVCRKLGVESVVEPVRGLFGETLPAARERMGSVALLHLDGDWYDSTRDVLVNLYDQVIDGGRLQIDDYGYWEGCRRAVEDFQKQRGLRFDLQAIDGTGVWFQKSPQGKDSLTGPDQTGAESTLDQVCPKASDASQGPPLRLLNLGCGGHFHSAWVNVDVVPSAPGVIAHDLQQPLPFPDGHFAAVYHSHVLEHLSAGQALPFLRECHRVLAPGGVLRVVVPDLEMIARLYLENLAAAASGDAAARERHRWITIELLDQMVREQPGGEMLRYWRQNPMPAEEFVLQRVGQEARRALALLRGPSPPPPPTPPADAAALGRFRQSGEVHKWMYDRVSLADLLRQAGFHAMTICAANESRIPAFNSYLLDVTENGSTRKPDSLFMEALKMRNL